MSTMELGDRLVHVRSTVKHEKPEKDLFTQDDVAYCMSCGMSMWNQETVPQGYVVVPCGTAKLKLDLLGPYCVNRMEYVLLKCLDGVAVLLLCVYCVIAHIVVFSMCLVGRAFLALVGRNEKH